MISHLPVLGICGFSGSGKTTLILELIPLLREKGIRVAVIKHNVPGLEVDKEGKDSDRLFKAGADVVMRGRDQSFMRTQSGDEKDLEEVLMDLTASCDLIILEGHKAALGIEKVWLEDKAGGDCPSDADNVSEVLSWQEDRVARMIAYIDVWLEKRVLMTPLYGGVLIGGKSRRMGEPKHLIKMPDGRSWLEHAVDTVGEVVDEVVILGAGDVPDSLQGVKVLPDIDDVGGPMSGILSAMRWAPYVSWLFTACDQPRISVESLEWLKGQRKPGVWAVMPETDEKGVNPFPGLYDFRAATVLRRLDRPTSASASDKVISPVVPSEISDSWANINAPADML